jgi:hypothetical protein
MNKNKFNGGSKMPAPVAPVPQPVPSDPNIESPPFYKKSHKGKFKKLKDVLKNG